MSTKLPYSIVKRLRKKDFGFTIVEVVIVVALSSLLLTALLRFLVAGYPLSRIAFLQQQSTEDARLTLKRLGKALREARPADTGAYPLIEMSPQRIIFYSDIDADNTTERVRYELIGSNLERGTTEPSGNPLTYDPQSNEVSTIVTRKIHNETTPIFTYYNGDYPVDFTPLSPLDLTEVKYIQFYLEIDADPNNDPPPIEIRSQVQLRNLKTNLGQTTN